MAGLTATFGFPYSSQFVLSGHSCCDSGTGQLPRSPRPQSHVCSCQLEQVLQQKMNAALPLGLLPRANFSAEPNLVFGPTTREPCAVYPPLVRQCDIKEMNGGGFNPAWYANTRFEHPNFEQPNYLACHRFGDRFSPIDLNSGARRKNATRETTSTLKAWLYEHRKNPYPTKGEKIMLAILTKMTLTQVSTWFANARRRLKKENKMTWSPRNRCGERKDSEGYSDDDDDMADEDENEKVGQDVGEKRESLTCRQTTVIKTAEDANNVWRTDPALSRLTSKIEALTPELNSRDIITPQRSDQRIIWSNERSPTETDRASPQHASPALQDSPVKSLRKWVDGCFDENRSGTVRSPLTDTPPLTPPSETERLPERVIHSTKKQTPPPTRNTPPAPIDVSVVNENEERSSDHEEDGTTNREIDAALALTTLFSRN